MQSFKKSAMVEKRKYEIAFVGLKIGTHEFNYELDEHFFKENGAVDEDKIEANVKLFLEKNVGFLQLKLMVGGKANVQCDRCGNPLLLDLWDEFKLVVKLVENPDELNNEESDPDVFYLARSESHIDVKEWLYEFVLLSVPTQKLCENDANGAKECNADMLKKLSELSITDDDKNANSIWKGLEKFKNN